MRVRTKHRIQDAAAVLVVVLVVAFPVAWALSLLRGHGGTYGPAVLLTGALGAVGLLCVAVASAR